MLAERDWHGRFIRHGGPDATAPEHAAPGLGRLIRALRCAQGWTESELGRRSRLSSSCISRLELGRRGHCRYTVERIAEALHLSDCQTGELLYAAGYLSPALQTLGVGDTTVTAVVAALTDERLTDAARDDLRMVIESVCERWGRRTNGRRP